MKWREDWQPLYACAEREKRIGKNDCEGDDKARAAAAHQGEERKKGEK
jgi:hypothetical protein